MAVFNFEFGEDDETNGSRSAGSAVCCWGGVSSTQLLVMYGDVLYHWISLDNLAKEYSIIIRVIRIIILEYRVKHNQLVPIQNLVGLALF